MFLPSLINLLLFPLSSLCSVIQTVADVQPKCNPDTSFEEAAKIRKMASETFTSCLSSISEPSNKEEFYKFVCTDMAQTGYKCLNGLMEDGCMHIYLKTHYQHIIQVFNATINEQCEGGKEGFMARSPAIEDMSCKPQFVEWSVDIYQKCFPSMEVLFGEHVRMYESPIFTSDLCRGSEIEECIFGILNGTCGNRALNVYGFNLMKQGLILCDNIAPDPNQEESGRFGGIVSALIWYLDRKCYLNANKEALQHLNWAYNLHGNLSQPSSPESMYMFVCIDLPIQFYPYLENLLDKLVHCLEPESKFLAEFVFSAFNNSIAQVCRDEDAFIARTNEVEDVNCKSAMNGTDVIDIISRVCLTKNFFKNEFYVDPELILTKEFVCSELKLITDCINETLNMYCDSDKMAQYVRGFVEPFLSSCQEDISENLI